MQNKCKVSREVDSPQCPVKGRQGADSEGLKPILSCALEQLQAGSSELAAFVQSLGGGLWACLEYLVAINVRLWDAGAVN